MKAYLSYWGLLFYPLVGLLLSAILTKVCIRVLPRLGYVDEPGGRRQHERSVPRGGQPSVQSREPLPLRIRLGE